MISPSNWSFSKLSYKAIQTNPAVVVALHKGSWSCTDQLADAASAWNRKWRTWNKWYLALQWPLCMMVTTYYKLCIDWKWLCASFRAISTFQMLASPHGNSKSIQIWIFHLIKPDVFNISDNIYYEPTNGAVKSRIKYLEVLRPILIGIAEDHSKLS